MKNEKKLEDSTNDEIKKNYKKTRINCKNLFLTYSQVNNITTEEIFEFLKNILVKWGIRNYAIQSELHEDNGKHIHAFIECKTKIDIKSMLYFDFKKEGEIFHPHIQAAKDVNQCVSYIMKEKRKPDTLLSPDYKYKITEDGRFLKVEEIIIKLARQGNITEALQMYENAFPKDFLKSHASIEASLKALYEKESGTALKYTLDQFKPPKFFLEFIEEWNENRITNKKLQTLVILGETGLGKTKFIAAWLKSLNLVPIYIKNLAGFAILNKYKLNMNGNNTFVLILDDFNFKYNADAHLKLGREEIITIVDSEDSGTLRVLKNIVEIPYGLPRIIITNLPLEQTNFSFLDPAVRRRLTKINICNYSLQNGEKVKNEEFKLDDWKYDLEFIYQYHNDGTFHAKHYYDIEYTWINPSQKLWEEKNLIDPSTTSFIIKAQAEKKDISAKKFQLERETGLRPNLGDLEHSFIPYGMDMD